MFEPSRTDYRVIVTVIVTKQSRCYLSMQEYSVLKDWFSIILRIKPEHENM